MAVRNFDTNTERVASFFDATTYFYGWKNSEPIPDDKDFKIKYNELYTAIRSGLASAAGLTNGSVLFAQSSALAQDNANLFWDNTLKRLGIGTNTPTAKLQIVGGEIAHRVNSSNYSVAINSDNLYTATGNYNFVANVRSPLILTSTNVFFANNSAQAVGNNNVSNTIAIGGTTLIQTNSIALLANATQSNSIVIGVGSSMSNVNNKPNLRTVIVGNNNTGLTAVGLGTGIGSIVYGYSNNVVSTGDNATHDYTAIVIGRNNDIRQNHTGSIGIQKIVIGRDINDQQTSILKNSFGVGFSAYAFLHDLTQRNELYGGLLLTDAGYDQNSTNTKYLNNGVAPTTLIANTHAYYSADVVPGNASPHFRTEAGNVVKLYSETTAVSAGTFVANTSGIVDDSATFGGYTIGQIVNALKNFGLLT